MGRAAEVHLDSVFLRVDFGELLLNLLTESVHPALQLLIVSRGVHIIRARHEVFNSGFLLLTTLRIAHG